MKLASLTSSTMGGYDRKMLDSCYNQWGEPGEEELMGSGPGPPGKWPLGHLEGPAPQGWLVEMDILALL